MLLCDICGSKQQVREVTLLIIERQNTGSIKLPEFAKKRRDLCGICTEKVQAYFNNDNQIYHDSDRGSTRVP